MPRYRRLHAPGTVQHIVARFVDHEFRLDHPGARAEYLRRAAKALERTDWKAIAFALMSSHVHWAFLAGTRPSADFMLRLHSGFASWLNRAQGRLGPVFADRHRVVICQGESAAALVAYIHNNPVRGRAVADAVRSDWTSHRAYLGLATAPAWLHVGLGLQLCGYANSVAGRRAFAAYAARCTSQPRDVALSGGDLQRRRRRVRALLSSPVEIATPTVSGRATELVASAPVVVPAESLLRAPWRGTVTAILRACAEDAKVALPLLLSRSRRRDLVDVRRVALLAWTLHLHRRAIEMARALGITSSSASALTSNASSALHLRAEAVARRVREAHPVKRAPKGRAA